VVSCGVRLSEVGFEAIPKPRVRLLVSCPSVDSSRRGPCDGALYYLTRILIAPKVTLSGLKLR
jgi:hypothetical protein